MNLALGDSIEQVVTVRQARGLLRLGRHHRGRHGGCRTDDAWSRATVSGVRDPDVKVRDQAKCYQVL